MNYEKLLSILIKTDPFEILETDVLLELAEKIEVRNFQANSFVFKQGEPSQDALFIVASGLVELIVNNERGDETVIGLKRAYDFFGETVVLSRQRYPASVRVKRDLTCCLVFRKDLEKIMYNYPEFSGFFNALLTERLRLLYEEIAEEMSLRGHGIDGISSGFFRKRVSQIMSYPAITCLTTDLVTTASKIMADKDINAIVAIDHENQPRGILTEKNLVKYLIAQQMYPVETCRVENIMYSNLGEIRPHAFIGQALVAMMRSKIKHLIVMERGELVGIVSMVDLIKTQSAGTLQLTKDIESQPDMKGLALVNSEIQNILKAMVEEKADINEIFDVMSELRERLTRRVIQLSEEKMKLEGLGPPPVEYCWINMGSAARYEQTFETEQDNAMIYENPEPEEMETVNLYFKKLAELIVDGLEKCGISKCKQGIMASNDRWRKTSGEWTETLRNWSEFPVFETTKKILAFLDFRPVWGNMVMAEDLRNKLFNAFQICSESKIDQEKNDMEYNPPISYLGTFLIENSGIHKNEMNLKTSAVMQIINSIRIIAVQNNIKEPSTIGRLKHLAEAGIISEEEKESFSQGFETLIQFQLKENLKKVKNGQQPDNYLDPYSLRKKERVELKEALGCVTALLDIIREKSGELWVQYL
ncbi:putative CBS domain and cyclic nucleotide-regulated nucleotidyltransferase [Desulfonema limicola]|uniref:CBS domain and cyclic nucleotide-regulated nucleotidyltransferase n=1 Tax=Desulfonema limicola TaxID=45656 RepID=A0A975B5H8_9BACT|nr:DUF294 nucleotidyltransferase-like domain-containing protein [Desulfonema limicola]QTA79147.1 putative CBS domain and cyclic nucleotide-regulated nucleotidyltransferase [Desulfonema limicola]